MSKLTTEEFIRKAKEKHGNRYDYAKTNYINARIKITIICPEHGEFEQIPHKHLNSREGCIKCAGYYNYTTKEWIEEAKKVHGDKYDYSKVNYINNKIKVIIVCPEHGEFEQISGSHLSKHGCLKCGGTYNYTTKEWIEEAKKVHDDKYNYSKVNYINTRAKITIICSEGHEFEQIPNSHLSGVGCPICNNSKSEMLIHTLLKEQSIQFVEQYSYGDLIGNSGGLLRFDFAIFKSSKLMFLLEYQGEQHFRPWHSNTEKLKKKFKVLQIHDTLKTEYCVKNDIPLEYINYDMNIEEKLECLLNKYELKLIKT